MKLMALVMGVFFRRGSKPSVYSVAISEAIRDLFSEMGYHITEKQHDR